MATYCPTCGTSNPDDAKNCHICDTILTRFSSDGALASGTLINYRYRITKLIKAGGMGAVYLAKDIKTNEVHAVKELFKQFSPQEEQYVVQRFKEEAEILAKLRHPNMPRVSDYFHDYDRYYIVMDYVQGDDLESILEQEGDPGLPELDVVDWAVQICGVLDYLHNQNPLILYRDLKPSNIMIRYEDGRAMLIDFGLARTIQPGSERGKTAIGTEGYSPPEQYMGNPEIRSDIYALGATMHHLLTGEFPAVPFQFNYVRDLNPDVSEGMEKLVMKAVEIELNDRYVSAKEMEQALITLYPKTVKRIDYIKSLMKDKDYALPASEPPHNLKSEIKLDIKVKEEVKEEKDEEEFIETIEKIDDHLAETERVLMKKVDSLPDKDDKKEISEKENLSEEDKFVYLIKKLSSRDILEKENAIEELGELKDRRAVNFLREILEYNNETLTRAVIKAFGEIKDPSTVPILIRYLDSRDPLTNQYCAVALGDIGDPQALNPLINLLSYGDEGSRATAAYALGNLGKKESLFALITSFLEDSDSEVRLRSAESIAQIDGRNMSSLIDMAKDEDTDTRKDLVRMFFSDYTIKDKKPLTVSLPSEYNKYIEMLKSNDEAIRLDGLSFLIQTEDPQVAPILTTCFEDENETIAIDALKAVVGMKNKDTLEAVINLLSTTRPILRQWTVWGLGEFGDERAFDVLLNTLKHDDPGTRATAAYSLGNLGDKRAVRPLLQLIIDDIDIDVRKNATESVLQLDAETVIPNLSDIAMDENREKRKGAIQKYLSKEQGVEEKIEVNKEIEQYLIDLKSNNPLARKNACRSLGNMKIPRVIPYIVEALKDEDENVCRAAGYSLLQYPDAVQYLIPLLSYEKSLTVQMAIWILGELKAHEATLQIINTLSRGNDDIRQNSAYSLGNIGDKRAIEPLLERILEDNNKDVRVYCAEALKKIDITRDINKLIKVARSDDKLLRENLIKAVYSKGPSQNTPEEIALEEETIEGVENLSHNNPEIRKNTIIQLANKYKNKSIPYILVCLEDRDETVKDKAIQVLVELGEASAVDKLVKCIKDPSPVIQQRAVWALGELKDRRALPVLIDRLKKAITPVRASAAYALGNLGDERAVEPLCYSLLNDEDVDVRRYAVESLEQIGSSSASNTLFQALKKEQDIETRKIISRVFSKLRFKIGTPKK
ncbi:MAG TPA: HEAT repeat domain-containing protein [Candidatus Eremiobacteraeota bacterium]|nr:MAG: Serine/threonine-protein kinase C [bacterium ADurb.Bin363]HPZ06568.1 HEAT repeat domain-containing protein [Candidatus Eremiobacteraeota bacterium]